MFYLYMTVALILLALGVAPTYVLIGMGLLVLEKVYDMEKAIKADKENA